MNFEEARAQFPVLEKLAYLNAGTFGPIARATHEAIVRELRRDYRDGRSGSPNFARVMELREQLRQRIAALVGAQPVQVALTTSTTDGCNIVLGGLGLGADDEIVTTTDEHFGLLGHSRRRARASLSSHPTPMRSAPPSRRVRACSRSHR
jgi:L-cysteine/cystine lyase